MAGSSPSEEAPISFNKDKVEWPGALYALQTQLGLNSTPWGKDCPLTERICPLFTLWQKVGFDEAFLIMENLATLRSEMVQRLLVMCRSIKVKRLFMFMAEKHGHPWVSDLDLSRLDLGKGKRMIIPKGSFDRKYRITVPRDRYEEGTFISERRGD